MNCKACQKKACQVQVCLKSYNVCQKSACQVQSVPKILQSVPEGRAYEEIYYCNVSCRYSDPNRVTTYVNESR